MNRRTVATALASSLIGGSAGAGIVALATHTSAAPAPQTTMSYTLDVGWHGQQRARTIQFNGDDIQRALSDLYDRLNVPCNARAEGIGGLGGLC